MNSSRIIIDCERMKYPHTGLYHYCYNLGVALKQQADPSLEKLTFFLPPAEQDVFGADQDYMLQKPWHKLMLPSLRKYTLWHCTHQDADYFPAGKRLRVVLTVHDINTMHNQHKSEQKKKQFIRSIEKKIKRADHITFISKFTRDDVQQYIDLGGKPVSVIYNGCNIKEAGQLTAPAAMPAAPFLFTIGTIMEKKNFHVLPALLGGNDRKLVIAGITQSEAYKKRIIEEAVKHGVEQRLIFTGPISENDKQWYLKNCEAFVFPSLTEGFGLPVVEAMHFGVPIFLSRFTSLPEIGGDVCYYFSSFEKEAMKHAVQKGLDHYNTTDAKNNIRKRAEMFSWRDAATQYLGVYRSLY